MTAPSALKIRKILSDDTPAQIKKIIEALNANKTLIHKALPARFQFPAPIFCAATVLMADAMAVDGSMASYVKAG